MPSRRRVLAGSTSFLLSAAAWSQTPQSLGGRDSGGKGRLCLGLNGISYYAGFSPFLNWWKVAGNYNIARRSVAAIGGKAAFDIGNYLDPDEGEIARPAPSDLHSFTRLFYAAPGQGNTAGGYNFSGMEWTIAWDGSADCTIGGLTEGGAQSIFSARARGTFRFGKNPGNTWASFTITDPNDPPRNIRIYQSSYDANVKAGETFNPDWLAQIRNFGVLRFMDWMATNNSEIAEFSQIADERYFSWGQSLTRLSSHGPKGGMPLSIICKLANLTQCNVHFCIPHLATDACVEAIATYFRDNLEPAIVVTFEYSNECWNYIFRQTRYCRDQGQAIWPGGGATRWYGYRSAQCMKIIRDVFNSRTRWRGCLATQTVNVDVTRSILSGIDFFITNGPSSTNTFAISDLFDEISVTGYFGDVQSSRRLDKVSNSNPAVVTAPSHGYKNGQRLKLFVASGMTELNNTFAMVDNAATDTFELAGVNSTSFKLSVTDNRNYAHPAHVFELMDKSAAQHLANPTRFPTKYSLFNHICAYSWLNGITEDFSTSVSVRSLKENFWPAQKAVADAHGLDLRQYEGGLHYVGDTYLAGYGGNPQFTEFLVNIGHTKETAEIYSAMYAAFFQVGGNYPAKFVEAGQTSQYGTWAGMRFIPGDEINPVWTATRDANGT
jgi:hypothetical protein